MYQFRRSRRTEQHLPVRWFALVSASGDDAGPFRCAQRGDQCHCCKERAIELEVLLCFFGIIVSCDQTNEPQSVESD